MKDYIDQSPKPKLFKLKMCTFSVEMHTFCENACILCKLDENAHIFIGNARIFLKMQENARISLRNERPLPARVTVSLIWSTAAVKEYITFNIIT